MNRKLNNLQELKEKIEEEICYCNYCIETKNDQIKQEFTHKLFAYQNVLTAMPDTENKQDKVPSYECVHPFDNLFFREDGEIFCKKCDRKLTE